MVFEPIRLEEVLAIIFGISIILIPVTGFTLRFALKPLFEAFTQARARTATTETIALLEKRVEFLERQLQLQRPVAPTQEPVMGVADRAPRGVVRVD